MATDASPQLLAQLDAAIAACSTFQHKPFDLGEATQKTAHALVLAQAAIERASGTESPYSRQLQAAIAQYTGANVAANVLIAEGIARALRTDIAAGHLRTITEIVHADLFSDYLEMASHLIDNGYKDPAAVIVGSTLESHLRQLCSKVGITSDVGGKPKKAESLNSELATKGTISKLDQKNVTAWLDLRNKAAHGHYSDYSIEQVTLTLSGVRDFITRSPA